MYMLYYFFESTVVQFAPVAQDMLLLFIGWYGQDSFRPSALNLVRPPYI